MGKKTLRDKVNKAASRRARDAQRWEANDNHDLIVDHVDEHVAAVGKALAKMQARLDAYERAHPGVKGA